MSGIELNDVVDRTSHRRVNDFRKNRWHTASLELEDALLDSEDGFQHPGQPDDAAREIHNDESIVPTRHRSTTSSRPSTISSGRSSMPGLRTSSRASRRSSITSYSSDWTGPHTVNVSAFGELDSDKPVEGQFDKLAREFNEGDLVFVMHRDKSTGWVSVKTVRVKSARLRPDVPEWEYHLVNERNNRSFAGDTWFREHQLIMNDMAPPERGQTDIPTGTSHRSKPVASRDWPRQSFEVAQQDSLAYPQLDSNHSTAKIFSRASMRSTEAIVSMISPLRRSRRYDRQLFLPAPSGAAGIDTSKHWMYAPEVSSVQNWLASVAFLEDVHEEDILEEATSCESCRVTATIIEVNPLGTSFPCISPGCQPDPFKTWPQVPHGRRTVSCGAIRNALEPLYIISIVLRVSVTEQALPQKLPGRSKPNEHHAVGVPKLKISEAHQSLIPRRTVTWSLDSQFTLGAVRRDVFCFMQAPRIVIFLQALSRAASAHCSKNSLSPVGALQSLWHDGLAVCELVSGCNFVFQASIAPSRKASRERRCTSDEVTIRKRPDLRIDLRDAQEQPKQIDSVNRPSNESAAVTLQAAPGYLVHQVRREPNFDEAAQKTTSFEYSLGFTASPFDDTSKRWRVKYESRTIRSPVATASATMVSNEEVAKLKVPTGRAHELARPHPDWMTEESNDRLFDESHATLLQEIPINMFTILTILYLPLSFMASVLWMNLDGFTLRGIWTEQADNIFSIAGQLLLSIVWGLLAIALWRRISGITSKQSVLSAPNRESLRKPPTEVRLLEWDCSRGNRVHGRYSNVEAHKNSRLVKSLPNCRVVWTSHDLNQQSDTSSNVSTPTVSRSDSSSSSHSSSSSPSTPASSVSGASASPLASGSGPKPAYFELCVNRGDMQISLGEIQLNSGWGEQLVKGDIALISEIRKRYDSLRRIGLHGHFYRPADIHWVKNGVQQRGVETGIYQSPQAIPPAVEVKEGRYHYFECPLEEMPPIAKETFFHYFWHHHKPDPSRTVFYERMPKKLGSSIFCQYDPNKLQFGWGMHIVEGPNKSLIAWMATAIVVLSFVVAVVYDVLLKNKDSGFAIGQWMLAVLATSLAALYFHVADAV